MTETVFYPFIQCCLLNGPIPASFSVYFRLSTCRNLNSNWNWKKCRWCAWDLNPGRQEGRRRQIHWATAAPHLYIIVVLHFYRWIHFIDDILQLYTALLCTLLLRQSSLCEELLKSTFVMIFCKSSRDSYDVNVINRWKFKIDEFVIFQLLQIFQENGLKRILAVRCCRK